MDFFIPTHSHAMMCVWPWVLHKEGSGFAEEQEYTWNIGLRVEYSFFKIDTTRLMVTEKEEWDGLQTQDVSETKDVLSRGKEKQNKTTKWTMIAIFTYLKGFHV